MVVWGEEEFVLVVLSQSRASVTMEEQTLWHWGGTSSLSMSCARPMVEMAKARARLRNCIFAVEVSKKSGLSIIGW